MNREIRMPFWPGLIPNLSLPPHLRRVVLAMIAATIGLTVSAQAAEISKLYDVVVPPPEKGQRRDSAFSEALRLVAVRASGVRDAGVKMTRVAPDARRYVQNLNVVKADGTVAVGFDRVTIEQLLTKADLPIWGRERPTTLVWLRLGEGRWVNAGSTSPERDVLDKVAQARGLPLVWPAMDSQDLAAATSLLSSHTLEQLMATASRYKADAVLLGIAGSDSAGQATAQFSLAFSGELTEQLGSLEEGVHLAADRCAKLLAVPSNVSSEVKIRVLGVGNLDAYARALNYLEGMSMVRSVAVEQLQADVLDMRLSVRGDSNVLRRTVAIDRRMQVDETAGNVLNFKLIN
jgi:uncharacterized protein